MSLLIAVAKYSNDAAQQGRTEAYNGAAIRSMCDLGAQLTASWNRLYAGFCPGGKTGEPGEKPSKQRREPTQTQPTYGVWSGNRTSATLVGGECSHHCAIPALKKGESLRSQFSQSVTGSRGDMFVVRTSKPVENI